MQIPEEMNFSWSFAHSAEHTWTSDTQISVLALTRGKHRTNFDTLSPNRTPKAAPGSLSH